MHVYKQYNQDELDKQFNNRLHVPDYADYFRRWELLSAEAVRKLPVTKDVQYGALPRERLDVFPSPLPHSKTLVFVHGGYWQMLNKCMFSFIANSFHSSGVTTVVLTYPLCPEVSIDRIISSVTNAVSWVYKNIAAFNGDPNQIHIAGHSAGGHLAAMLMTKNFTLLNPQLPADLLKGTCVISGLFDLVPVRLSYLNKGLHMDEETALRNSPVLLHPLNTCPLIIAVGGEETAAFNDQSKGLFEAWKDQGVDVQLLQLPQLNHFSIIETMSHPGTNLNKAIRQLMKIE